LAGGLLYLDSSALVKLVIREEETPALQHLLRESGAVVSSALAEVEVRRAVRRVTSEETTLGLASQVMAGVHLLRLDEPVLSAAAGLPPDKLRTLDALHLASALSLGSDLSAMVVYDERLAEAAREAGLTVLAPR
jgi:predicted nucleic acid-binding protein